MEIIFSILFIIAIIVCPVLLFSGEYRRFSLAAFGVAVFLFILSIFITVPQGYRGVVLTFGKVSGIMTEGLNTRMPLIQSVQRMSIKTQLFSVEATAASKDLQDVKTNIGLNYRLEPLQVGTIYGTIGLDYIEVIAHPLIQETVKEITAKFNAEDMILKRADVKEAITVALIERLSIRGIIAEQVNITDFSFSPEFTNAIESKVVAIQKVMEAENYLRQIEVEARQAVARAQGEANSAIARAEGQAKANAIIAASLTPDILRYIFLDKLTPNVRLIVVPDGQVLTLGLPSDNTSIIK